jgi:ParB family chromosome partitioning protein
VARKSGLGRGLEALLPEGDYGEPQQGSVAQIAIDKVIPDPDQPRKHFDEATIQQMAASIIKHGIIQPIIARDAGDGSYIIISGEQRFRAAKLAGLEEIPVIVREMADPKKRMEIALIENIQRSDLNPIEVAEAYKNLMDSAGLSQEELAAQIGKPRSTVANALRLLKLSGEIQESLKKGKDKGGIDPGHANALLSVADKKLREKLYREITEKGLSVRDTEKRASALNTAPAAEGEKAKPVKRPVEITDMEQKFIDRLDTKVTIEGGLEKGKIHIEYYSMDHLDRLYEIIQG